MADKTAIEWTDATWNPIVGCTRVSAGCDGCYAITNARIRESNPNPAVAAAYAGVVEQRDGRVDWTGQVNLLDDRLDQPLRWTKPRRIFVNAQSDLFHENVPDEFIARIFAVMAIADRHTFQVLTKRHARMRSLLGSEAFFDLVNREYVCSASDVPSIRGYAWPLPNVWLGVSVEDQRSAGIRTSALRDTPAAVRFLSCEPLLAPLDLDPFLWRRISPTQMSGQALNDGGYACSDFVERDDRIGWVIVGGESGKNARPMHPDWARQLRDQCAAAGVPFLFKQWGEWSPVSPGGLGKKKLVAMLPDGSLYDGKTHESWQASTTLYRVGKKAAGRELDGTTHDGYPEAKP